MTSIQKTEAIRAEAGSRDWKLEFWKVLLARILCFRQAGVCLKLSRVQRAESAFTPRDQLGYSNDTGQQDCFEQPGLRVQIKDGANASKHSDAVQEVQESLRRRTKH